MTGWPAADLRMNEKGLDLEPAGWFTPNLRLPPFDFPEPLGARGAGGEVREGLLFLGSSWCLQGREVRDVFVGVSNTVLGRSWRTKGGSVVRDVLKVFWVVRGVYEGVLGTE